MRFEKKSGETLLVVFIVVVAVVVTLRSLFVAVVDVVAVGLPK